MSNKAFKWNALPSVAAEAGFDAAIRMNDVQGVLCGRTQSMPLAAGQVLKKGTLLSKSGASLVKIPSLAETTSLTLDADITGTTAKLVVLTVAGLTITSTSNILYVSDLCLLLDGAEAGTTGAALLATFTAAGGTGISAVSGTLTGYHVLVDEANRKLLFVSTSFQAGVTDLTFTCEDTASTPVDLSSHITEATVAFSSPTIVAVLAIDADTTSGADSYAVFTEGRFYNNYLQLAQEPAVDTVNGVRGTLFASGIYTHEQLAFALAGTEIEVVDAGTATI